MSVSVSLMSDILSRQPTIYTIFFGKDVHLYSITYIKHFCLSGVDPEILKSVCVCVKLGMANCWELRITIFI